MRANKIKYKYIYIYIYMSGFLKMVLKNCTPDLDFTEVVAHPTSNQGDAGSISTHGTYMFFHSKRIS